MQATEQAHQSAHLLTNFQLKLRSGKIGSMLLRNACNIARVFAQLISVSGPGSGRYASRLFEQAVQRTALQTLVF